MRPPDIPERPGTRFRSMGDPPRQGCVFCARALFLSSVQAHHVHGGAPSMNRTAGTNTSMTQGSWRRPVTVHRASHLCGSSLAHGLGAGKHFQGINRQAAGFPDRQENPENLNWTGFTGWTGKSERPWGFDRGESGKEEAPAHPATHERPLHRPLSRRPAPKPP